MAAVHDHLSPSISVEVVQIEAVVDALQSHLWAEIFNVEAFLDGVRSATFARGNPPVVLAGIDQKSALYDQALVLLTRWQSISKYQDIELRFSAGSA